MTVGEPERDGRRSSPRTTSASIPNVSLLDEASGMPKTAASGSNESLLSEIGATRVRDELVRDSRSTITGFLEDNRMKSTAGRRQDLCGILARWARVPLEHREAVLVVHEVAVRVEEGGLGCAKRTIDRT